MSACVEDHGLTLEEAARRSALHVEPPRGEYRVMTISMAAELYLAESARQGKSAKTRDRYGRHFNKLADMYPHYDVNEVTPVMIRRFLDQWAAKSPATSAQIISMLRSLFKWLHGEGIVPSNPTERLERPRLPRPEEQDHLTTLSSADVQKMLNASEGWTERITLHLLAYTGSRRNAVAQLRLRDYDHEAGEITFQEKGGKTIRKPIPGSLRGLLDAAIIAGIYESSDDFLIPSPGRARRKDGTRDSKVIWKIVKKVADRVGVEAHVHAFRAAFAVYFLETKPDKLLALQSLLGHSNLETTRVYLRKLDRKRQMEEVRDLDWGEGTPEMFQVSAVAEKEGFEPSFRGKQGSKPQGTPHDAVAAIRQRLDAKAGVRP